MHSAQVQGRRGIYALRTRTAPSATFARRHGRRGERPGGSVARNICRRRTDTSIEAQRQTQYVGRRAKTLTQDPLHPIETRSETACNELQPPSHREWLYSFHGAN